MVVIPCKPSDLDGKEAIKIVSFIKQQEKVTNRAINYSLLRTQTGAAIYTKIEQAIVEDFKSIGANGWIKLVNATNHLLFTPSKNQKVA